MPNEYDTKAERIQHKEERMMDKPIQELENISTNNVKQALTKYPKMKSTGNEELPNFFVLSSVINS